MDIYNFSALDIKGQERSLSEYKGKTLVIVNTASKCGLTPQYEGLEKLYQQYKDQGLEILGFPCNQFGSQEPGDEKNIEEFCSINYGVSFPMFSKIEVNGSAAHPLYKYLKQEKGGLLGSAIKWNFTKFVVSKEGKVLKRFAPTASPESMEDYLKAIL